MLGSPIEIPEPLHSVSMPVLVQAFAAHVADPVAYDRVLVKPGERPMLYLQPGRYDLIAHRGDGAILAEVTVEVR